MKRTREYNLALGERRANAVKEFLVSLGVEQGELLQLVTVKKDQQQKVVLRSWAENRRSVTVISGD